MRRDHFDGHPPCPARSWWWSIIVLEKTLSCCCGHFCCASVLLGAGHRNVVSPKLDGWAFVQMCNGTRDPSWEHGVVAKLKKYLFLRTHEFHFMHHFISIFTNRMFSYLQCLILFKMFSYAQTTILLSSPKSCTPAPPLHSMQLMFKKTLGRWVCNDFWVFEFWVLCLQWVLRQKKYNIIPISLASTFERFV